MGIGAAIAGVGAAASIGSSLIGSSAQADATTSAQNSANATQLQALHDEQAVEKPYVDAGVSTLGQQNALLGLNGQDAANKAISTFQASPGYAYQVQQGLSAIDNGAAASGSLNSGNTLRAEEGLGSNLANQDFSNYYNRLAGITSLGQNAAANVGNAGIQTGSGIAQTDTSAGNQLANIYGQAASGVGSSINNGLNSLATLSGLGNSTSYTQYQATPAAATNYATISAPAPYSSDGNY